MAGYAGAIASSMPSGMNPSLALNSPFGENGHSYNQGYEFASRGNGINGQTQSSNQQQWPQLLQHTSLPGFMDQYNSSTASPQLSLKAEHSFTNRYSPTSISSKWMAAATTEPSNTSTNNVIAGLYPGATTSQYPLWNFSIDPSEDISNRLTDFCFPNNQVIGRSSDIRTYLSSANVEHFHNTIYQFPGATSPHPCSYI